MLKIRLSRTGKRNAPSYRVVLQESQKAPKSQAIEILGFYNPRTKEKKLEAERIQYWISKGAQASATAHNLFIKEGVLKAEKKRATHMTAKKRTKLEEKNKKAAEAKAAAEESKEAKTEEPKAEEAKAEEPKEEVAPAEDVKKVEKSEEEKK